MGRKEAERDGGEGWWGGMVKRDGGEEWWKRGGYKYKIRR